MKSELKHGFAYDIVIVVLALITVAITFLDITGKIIMSPLLTFVDYSIWIFFVFDYFFRLIRSDIKLHFFKQNIIDLISILPFNAFLRAFKVLRLFRLIKMTKAVRLLRMMAFVTRLTDRLKSLLHTNGFIYMIYISGAIIVAGAAGIYLFEYGVTVNSFTDALWWSFVTTTTVGYGDISPSSGIGRIIAVILMLTGISTIGMLTGTLATFFISSSKSTHDSTPDDFDIKIEFEHLSEKQKEIIKQIIESYNK